MSRDNSRDTNRSRYNRFFNFGGTFNSPTQFQIFLAIPDPVDRYHKYQNLIVVLKAS